MALWSMPFSVGGGGGITLAQDPPVTQAWKPIVWTFDGIGADSASIDLSSYGNGKAALLWIEATHPNPNSEYITLRTNSSANTQLVIPVAEGENGVAGLYMIGLVDNSFEAEVDISTGVWTTGTIRFLGLI